MLDASPFRLSIIWIAAAAVLAGCTTPRVEPQQSQAVVEARVRQNAPPRPTCPQAPLSAVAPVTVGFAFNDTELTEAMSQPLVDSARWIVCHPATRVIVKPDADTHGTAAEQDTLARRRAERVREYLTAHGVAADRVVILARGQPAPTGDVFLINAEGRRW